MKPLAESMTVAECWQCVGSRGVGRIGFDAGSGPRIHPVDYISDGSEVRLLTSETSELARFTRLFAAGGLVTFEVDQLDSSLGERWSVLVAGSVVDARRHGPDDQTLWPVPTPAGHRDWLVRLRPRQVTGRRLVSSGRAGRDVPIPGGEDPAGH